MLEGQSPLFSAKSIKAPLFVVQGANDPRVKKAESDQIVVALRDLGRNVEYMVAPDEGHGYSGLENRLAMYTAMEKFLGKYLSGRSQQDVREAIQKRLDAITVDIKTVALQKSTDTVSAAAEMPQFDGGLIRTGVLKYTMTVEARGQKIPMTLTRTIQKTAYNGKDVWRAIDDVTGMMGGSDTVDIDAKTLLPVRRSAKQGGGIVELAFTANAVDGRMRMGPQDMPVKAQLSSPALPDGAGTDLPMSTLPFADGYKATLMIFDMMSAKAKAMSLVVKPGEPGSAGNTWKIEVRPKDEDGSMTTTWVTKDTRTIVRSESVLPTQMGGGTVTMELTK
jgi:hypothetical protein